MNTLLRTLERLKAEHERQTAETVEALAERATRHGNHLTRPITDLAHADHHRAQQAEDQLTRVLSKR